MTQSPTVTNTLFTTANTTEPVQPALEIHVHLEDGRITRFVQNDVALAQSLLAQIQPTKLFGQKVLLLGSADSMSAFQLDKVVRIDLIAHNTPDYPFYNNVLDIQQITLDEFHERFHSETFAALRQIALEHPGDPLTVFSEMELVNGERIFMQVCVQVSQRTPLEQGLFVSQLFGAHGLHGRRRGGGVVILNPASIVRFTLYPPPPGLPPGTWQAARLGE